MSIDFFIPLNKSDLEALKKSIINKKNINILPLSPELFFLSIESGFSQITKKPNIFFKKSHHRKIVKSIIETDKFFKNYKFFVGLHKETLSPLIQAFLSSSLFIWYSLGDNINWIYVEEKKIKRTTKKKIIYEFALKKIFNKYQKDYFGQLTKFNNELLRYLNFYILKISLFLIPEKFSIISNKKFISVLKNRNTLILNKPSKYYFFKNIINIFKNIFVKNKELEFVPLKSKKNLLLQNHIYRIMNISNKIFEKDNFLIGVINDLINYNNSIFETYENLFIKKNIEFFFSDEIKFREMLVMGFYMKKISKTDKVYLSSHGIHSLLHKDKIANFQVLQNAHGLIHSNYAKNYIIQSKISYLFIKSIDCKNKKIYRSTPVTWSKESNKIFKNKNNYITLLHASTPKTLCSRPYLYESPFEYIESINFLIKKISKYQNIKIKFRLRGVPESNFKILCKLINFNNQCYLSETNNFSDDINSADALISYSSTTIEESISKGKPVLLFNSVGFNHFQSFEINSNDPIFILTKENFDSVMQKALHCIINTNRLRYNFSKYAWNYNSLNKFEIN